MRLLFNVFLLLGAFLNATASEPYMKHYGQREGLPNVQIYDLMGASDQLLYMGTANGLYRFNGIKFEKIAFEGQPTSLSYISESGGTIWCKDFSNRLFYIQNDSLKQFNAIQKYSQSGHLVNYYWLDSNLYFANQRELIKYSLRTKTAEVLFKTTVDTSNILDFSVSKGYLTMLLNRETLVFSLPLFKKEMQFNHVNLNGTITASAGIFYLTFRGITNQDAFEINPEIRRVRALGKLPPNVHGNFIRIWQKQIYWCTNNGVYVHNQTSNTFDYTFLSNKRVSDLLTDFRGNNWLSTLDHSIYLLPYIQNTVLAPTSLNDERFTALTRGRDNTILAGTNLGSLWEIDLNGNQREAMRGKAYDQTQFVDLDEETGVLYSTHGIRDANGKIIYSNFLGKSLARDKLGNFVYAAGEVVCMSGEQLFELPIAQKKPHIVRNGIKEILLRNHRARKVIYDSFRGLYLVAYSDCLMAYSVLGNEFEIKGPDGSRLIVNEMVSMPDNTVWLGTLNEGIWLIKGNTPVAMPGPKKGLSGSFVKKIVYSSPELIWVLTDKGLDCYQKESGEFEPFREILGLGSLNLFDLLIFNDLLFIACDQGVLKIPANPKIERRSPLLRIQQLKVNGEAWSLEQTTLPFVARNLKIEFLPIHFQSEGNIYAQYKLSVSDSTWTTLPAGAQSLTLYGLPAGEHELELRLLANNEHSESFYWHFKVAYPLWQRWWFIALMALSLIGITSLLSRSYNKRKLKARLIEEALAASQLTAMKAQMNPHFLYNVLNSIQGLIFANKKEEAADYLSKFSELMRLTLNFSDRQWHEISEEISALDLYLQLEAGRFSSDFSYDVRIDAATRRENPMVPSMLIQPYVENAIKHGLLHKVGPKRLTVDFSMHEDIQRIIISIEDNGIGRKHSAVLAEKKGKTHRSFATQSLQSRLQILNQLLAEPVEIETIDKKNEQQQPTGTLVIIRLPFKYS